MVSEGTPNAAYGGWIAVFRTVFSARMVIAFFMGLACGLPLLLTGSLLQAWMTEEGVELATVGLFALVGLPYTLKFLWAPFFDRYTPSFLGRRRGWLISAQALLAASIIGLGLTRPGEDALTVAVAAVLLTFFSASQDIVVDAYRREALADEELGLGAALYVNGYRLGMLLASGGGLILADHIPFSLVYLIMGSLMFMGILTTMLAPEPVTGVAAPASMRQAVVEPFREYFRRHHAWLVLLFILLYKIGDTMASHMTTPFYLDLGFSKTEIGAVVKLFGFWATVLGGLLGGLLIMRMGIMRSLWWFGLLQGVSTAGFVWLARIGDSVPALSAVIAFENLSGGLGTAAFLAYMGSQTNKRFTATQYALLSSLMGVPRVIVTAPTGLMADFMGWEAFFLLCAVLALPGLWLLRRLGPQQSAAR